MIPGSKTLSGVNPHTGWLPESSILDSHGGRTINDCPRFAERKCSRQLTCQFSTDWIPSSRILIFALRADWLRKFSKIFSAPPAVFVQVKSGVLTQMNILAKFPHQAPLFQNNTSTTVLTTLQLQGCVCQNKFHVYRNSFESLRTFFSTFHINLETVLKESTKTWIIFYFGIFT